MPTRNVVLTGRQTILVNRLVTSDRYQNASEVLREGLRLVAREEAEAQARLDALRDAASTGIADVGAGRFRDFASTQALGDYFAGLAEDALTPATRC